MRCIDADKLILKDLGDGIYLITQDSIMNAPTFEAEPIRYAKWIEYNSNNPFEIYGKCSERGFEQSISKNLNYCPNCGSKMNKLSKY